MTLAAGALLASLLAGGVGAAPGDLIATQVANINPAGASSNPDWLTNVNGTLFFAANDGSNGLELWKSDGTAAGTQMVEDIRTGALGSFPNNLILNVNGTLFFAASDQANGMELWKSVPPYDAASTSIVQDIRPGDQCSCPFNFASIGGTAFFAASNGTNGEELWKSDGTTASMVRDINTTPTVAASSNPSKLTNVNGTLLFAAIDGVTGTADVNEGEPWMSAAPYDAGSTLLVEDIRMGATGSIPFGFTTVGSTLFFNANDGPTVHGPELWKSASPFDPASTDIVEDIRMGVTGSFPGELTDVNGTLFFGADDGSGPGLWKSTDGTAANTNIVKDIDPGGGTTPLAELTNVNGTLFFAADGGAGTGAELWKSDGSMPGTDIIEDIRPGPTGSGLSNLTNVNGTLFFSADDGGGAGVELWKSDGTAAGTKLVADISPYVSLSPGAPPPLTDVNGTLFLSADDGATGVELWRTTIEGPGPPALIPPATPATTPTAKKCKKRSAVGAKKKKCKKKRKK